MRIDELLSDVYADTGHSSAPPTDVTTRITKNLKKAHRLILREPGLERLRATLEPLTFTSASGRAIYGLPSAIDRVLSITERDSDRAMAYMSLSELRLRDPGFTTTGTPAYWIPLGYSPVNQGMTTITGDAIHAVSTNVGDTQVLQFTTIQSGGLNSGDQALTMNGVTSVQLGSATDHMAVLMIQASVAAQGFINVYKSSVAAANLIAQIPPGQVHPQYYVIQLWPTPTSAVVYYADGSMRVPELDDTSDVPLLPDAFHDLLADYAKWREYEKMNDERAAFAEAQWREGLSRLKYFVNAHGGETPTVGVVSRRLTRLGPWTPAGSGF